MPTFVGKVNITTNTGSIQFGNSGNSTSITAEKRFFGAGSDNAGNINNILTAFNQMNTILNEKQLPLKQSPLNQIAKRDCPRKKGRKKKRKSRGMKGSKEGTSITIVGETVE